MVKSLGERLADWYNASRKKIMKSRTMVWAKLQYSLAAHRLHQFFYPPIQVTQLQHMYCLFVLFYY